LSPVTFFKRSSIVFPLACAAAVAMVLVSEGSYWQSARTLNELGAIQESRTTILGLAQSVLDAESGQRGYLLTDRQEYLQPYHKAVENINKSFKQLALYYQNQPEEAGAVAKLRALTDTRLSELAETIRLHDEGRIDAATELVLSDIGKEKMEAIRALSAQLLDHEANNLSTGRSDLYRTLLLNRIGVALLSVISLLALFLYLRQTTALVRQQVELKRIVQAERDRLDIEVRQRTAQLTELMHHLQTAREDERHRLARNLHDELGSLLTSAKLDAARIRSRLADTAPEALERLAHLVGTLNSSIALGRRIIEDLRPSTLGNLGLVSTLEILAREFAEQSGIEVQCALAPVSLGAPAELIFYRLVQEAITNVTKYARASHVWINLAARDGVAEVSVRDDGVGFDTSVRTRSAFGLMGMRFRVEAEGGTLTLVSAPGQGTLIQAKLPEASPVTT